MKKMKKLILAIFCFSIINISFSQSEKSDAEFVKVLKEYSLNADGSMEYHYSKELKLQSHFSFHRLYGETFIVYNTDFQELTINYAYTIMADGKRIETPKNAFNEVLPRFAANAPEFNNLREMVVTHTGLEVGTTIYLDYTIKTKKGFWPALMSDDILSESSPVNELLVKVNVPEGSKLNFDLLNIKAEVNEITEKDKTVYEWKFNSIPASSKDYYQSRDHAQSPRLIFSTAKDLFSIYSNFVNQEAFDMTTNESMDKAVAKVMEEKNDPLLIALELQKLVCNNLKTIDAPMEFNGFKCHTAAETWNRNKGTNIENAILFCSLLHKAGINAEPVVLIPNEYYNEKIGNLLNFDNFVVRVKLAKQGDVFLSAIHVNNNNVKFKLAGKTPLLLDKNIESLRVLSAKTSRNKIFVNGEFEIKESDKLEGKLHLVLEAGSNPYFSILNDEDKVKSLIKGGISAKDITSIKNVELKQEVLNSHLEISKEEAFSDFNTYFSFEIPYASKGVNSWHMNLLNKQRISALELPEAIHERYDFTFILNDELTMVTEPLNIEISNKAGYFHFKIVQRENNIIISKEIKLESKTIELESYSDFREIMNAWNTALYKKLIFKK
jgi:hypothetical protein